MILRAYKPEDAKEVVKLHLLSGRFFEDMEVSEEFIKNIAARPDFRIFVAEEKGKFVGFSGVLFHPSLGRAEVGPIAVEESHRNNGVGTMLLDQVVSFLKDSGIRRVCAKVKADNETGRAFFESRGFVQEGLFKSYTRSGEDVVQYVLFL